MSVSNTAETVKTILKNSPKVRQNFMSFILTKEPGDGSHKANNNTCT